MIMIVSIYVDNFLLASKNITAMEKLKIELANKYIVKGLDEIKTIIDWQITRDRAIKTLKVGQSALIKNLLKKKTLQTITLPPF